MEKGLGGKIDPMVYDGDTPNHLKPKIRKNSSLIITNPYGLHHYLPWHSKWKEFFANLEFVVLDEVHNYRGVFSSNIAMLFRRLKRIIKHYGSNPQYILSSATIANPEEFSKKLTGEEFEVISKDGSSSSKKYFVFWNPVEYHDISPHRQSAKLLSHTVDNGLQTLCFTTSRKWLNLYLNGHQKEIRTQ